MSWRWFGYIFVTTLTTTTTWQQSGNEGTTSPDNCLTSSDCGQGSECVLTNGQRYCRCKTGFRPRGSYCQDIDECISLTSTCHSNSTCTNTPGSYLCRCLQGYTGNGKTCLKLINDDDCRDEPSMCHHNATCKSGNGTKEYNCVCNSGYHGNGSWCEGNVEDTTHTNFLYLLTLLIIPLGLLVVFMKCRIRRRRSQTHEITNSFEMEEIGQEFEISLETAESILFDQDRIKKQFENLRGQFGNPAPYSRESYIPDMFQIPILRKRGISPSRMSFIDVRLDQQRLVFIATPNPSTSSLPDFFNTIWERKVKVVVCIEYEGMEKTRGAAYWTEGEKSFNGIKLWKTNEINHGCFTQRFFNLVGEKKISRQLIQLHFAIWPENGVPVTTSALIEICDIVDRERGDAPVLVHSRNGYGRAGTFIALSCFLHNFTSERKIEVYRTVMKIKKYQPLMLQNLTQYFFIYKVIAEKFICGNTSTEIREFSKYFGDLEKKVDKKDGVDHQYEKLFRVTRQWPLMFNPDRMKERHNDAGEPTAVRVYSLGDLCLLAPSPTSEDTFQIFSQTIFKDEPDIVMLSSKRGIPYGCFNPINFRFEDEEISHVYAIRKLFIQNSDYEETKLSHFQYISWNENSCPVHESKFLDFVLEIEDDRRMRRMHGGKTRPILIHSDDISKCVLFCGLFNLLRIIHHEVEIDVFRTFKDILDTAKEARLGEEQLRFCYSAVARHVSIERRLAFPRKSVPADVTTSFGEISD